MDMTDNRVLRVSAALNGWLENGVPEGRRSESYARLYGVSALAAGMAQERGLNQELAAIAGLLHDYYRLHTGIAEFRDQNGAEAARPLLRDFGIFSVEEQRIVLKAIFHHGNTEVRHGPFEELLKEAVRMYDGLYSPMASVCDERIKPMAYQGHIDKRAKLADLAETLASREIEGSPEEPLYREICSYWPDSDICNVLKNSWCAAFVYHCCREAGFLLPIRYPNGVCRFAGCGAWQEWGQLPENRFFHGVSDSAFKPQRGDIIIYEKLLSEESHDHIGIVLSWVGEEELLVAEGNMDNKNVSRLIRRSSWRNVSGYLRIDNAYRYRFDGEYRPLT